MTAGIAARAALFIMLATLSLSAQALVYTWREPVTGAKRVSNIPPGWYRQYEHVRGPRVVVTAGGTLIDDTWLPLGQRVDLARRHLQRNAPRGRW